MEDTERAVRVALEIWRRMKKVDESGRISKLVASSSVFFIPAYALFDSVLSLKMAKFPYYHLVSGRKRRMREFVFMLLLSLYVCKKLEESGAKVTLRKLKSEVERKLDLVRIPDARFKVGRIFFSLDAVDSVATALQIVAGQLRDAREKRKNVKYQNEAKP